MYRIQCTLNHDVKGGIDNKDNKNINLLTIKYRPYQLHGISWMLYLRDLGLHGLLCDDMGLGKTIQSISLFAHLTGK